MKELKEYINNADYGMTLQKMICDKYGLEINEKAYLQFTSSYNSEYEAELDNAIVEIFDKVGAKPIKLLTFTDEFTDIHQKVSPHNFLLENGKTLSIRTTKTSDKVAPRTLGQAGFETLNDYLGDVYGHKIESQIDIRKLIFYKIDEILPIFIEYLFISDVTVLLSRKDLNNIEIIKAENVADYSFLKSDFSFTRDLEFWTESNTLKYRGISIAEIQTHKERSFKFRFIISNIPYWFKTVKDTNETLGITAEDAICDFFSLEKPDSFKTRSSLILKRNLEPVISAAFKKLPAAVKHTGSTSGARGEQSKCPYDFILEGNKTLSLKTNIGKMVCPPEVGQPGASTCYEYFKDYISGNEMTRDAFKEMALNRIEEIMPIYVEHLFDSDYLLWIYKQNDAYAYKIFDSNFAKNAVWKKELFDFTKKSLEEWNESNTVKYLDIPIGEFQIHSKRNCFKFRFNMMNFANLIEDLAF